MEGQGHFWKNLDRLISIKPRPRYQVSVYRINGPLVYSVLIKVCRRSRRFFRYLRIIWAATWENRIFAYAKTKTQISFAVTAKLISAFVFATRIVQSLCFPNPKFQVSSHLQWLSSPACVGPGRNPRRPVFWRRGSYHQDNTSVWSIPLCTHFIFIVKLEFIGVYIIFLCFALRDRLWVLVRTARRF